MEIIIKFYKKVSFYEVFSIWWFEELRKGLDKILNF